MSQLLDLMARQPKKQQQMTLCRTHSSLRASPRGLLRFASKCSSLLRDWTCGVCCVTGKPSPVPKPRFMQHPRALPAQLLPARERVASSAAREAHLPRVTAPTQRSKDRTQHTPQAPAQPGPEPQVRTKPSWVAPWHRGRQPGPQACAALPGLLVAWLSPALGSGRAFCSSRGVLLLLSLGGICFYNWNVLLHV